jgi:hypothetical protein
MRQKSPERYIVTACNAIASAEEPDDDLDFKKVKTKEELAARLLKSVGVDEPTDEQIAAAVEANQNFTERLEEIAQGASNGRDG